MTNWQLGMIPPNIERLLAFTIQIQVPEGMMMFPYILGSVTMIRQFAYFSNWLLDMRWNI